MKRNRTTYKRITKEDKGRLFIELPKTYIIKAEIKKEEDIFKITKLNQEEKERWKKTKQK